jgi:hypothetical protein
VDGPPPPLGGALAAAPWLRAIALLLPPLGWMFVFYLAALAVPVRLGVLEHRLVHGEADAHVDVGQLPHDLQRSDVPPDRVADDLDGGGGHVTDAVVAFPFAYYMARIAGPRQRTLLFVLVLLPLWSSYLARIYAWRLILNHDGALNWTLGKLGLPTQGLGVHEHGDVDRLLVHLAAVHDPARSTRRWSASLTRTSRRRAISARATGRRSGASSSRWRCPASSPARSSPSR